MIAPVIPILMYKNIQAAHDFLVAAFGLRETMPVR